MKPSFKTLIIEDELLAANHLSKLVESTSHANIEIVDRVDSVKNAMKWLLKHDHPELILMDIDLSDGLCFEIFDVIEVKSPIIFTTAYDEFAIRAFKVNSIDYLLKPIDQQELDAAILKYLATTNHQSQAVVREIGRTLSKQYKERFVLKVGEHLKTIKTDSINYFFSRDKASYAVVDKRNYLLDFTMDQLADMLDPQQFFRISRRYIVQIDAIQDIIAYTNSRLRLVIKEGDDDQMVVSRERVKSFKDWLDR